MLRLAKAALAAAVLSLLLSSCWDLKDLQEVNYIRAIGFDLKDNEFMVYVQMLDFSTVAKVEGAKAGKTPAWVGIGRGSTLTDAIEDLYRTSQLRFFYGHINGIVIGENLLKDPIKANEAYEFVSRYYELRYTAWIYGTKLPIDKVLAVTSLFSFNPDVTILHQPLESYKQNSLVQPISVRQFNLELREPARTTLLPSLTINDQNMKEGEKKHPLLEINGAYLFNRTQYRGWISYNDLKGHPWVETETHRAPLIIDSGGRIQAALALENPKITIRPRVQNGKATYVINVYLSGVIVEMPEPISKADIERKAEEQVKKEIRKTFVEGLKRKADLFQLEQALYRNNNREWKKLHSEGGTELTADSLQEINVDVKLIRSGKTKVRKTERL